MPFATPTIEGWTVVGVGGKQGLLLRNGSGGHISNALLCNTSEGIEIEDKDDEVEDAYERWVAGDLTLENIVATGESTPWTTTAMLDGDDLLDTYAEENMVMNGEPEGLDYLFGFDAAGLQANNQLFLDVEQGSGHTFAAGWTFAVNATVWDRIQRFLVAPMTRPAITIPLPNPMMAHANFLATNAMTTMSTPSTMC